MDAKSSVVSNNLVFLAGPIDGANDSGKPWRVEVAHALKCKGFSSFNPAQAFDCSAPLPAEAIRRVNRAAIYMSKAVLAYLPKDVPSLGTAREIEYARNLLVPVVVVGPWLRNHSESFDVEIVEDFNEAVEYISGL